MVPKWRLGFNKLLEKIDKAGSTIIEGIGLNQVLEMTPCGTKRLDSGEGDKYKSVKQGSQKLGLGSWKGSRGIRACLGNNSNAREPLTLYPELVFREDFGAYR